MRIAELDAADVEHRLDELAQLLFDAHASNMALGLAPALGADDARETWRETARRLAPGDHVLLGAFDGDLLVGSVQLVRASAGNGRHRAEVRRLAVRADRRGEGIASRLLAELEQRAPELGISLLWLTTHTGTDADGIYEHLGWTRMGEMPGYAYLPDGTLAANAYFYVTLPRPSR